MMCRFWHNCVSSHGANVPSPHPRRELFELFRMKMPKPDHTEKCALPVAAKVVARDVVICFGEYMIVLMNLFSYRRNAFHHVEDYSTLIGAR